MTWEFLTDDLVLHLLRGFNKIKIRIQVPLFFHLEFQTFQFSLPNSLFRFAVLQSPACSALVHTINYQWPFFHLFASNFHSCKEHQLIKHHNRDLLRQEGEDASWHYQNLFWQNLNQGTAWRQRWRDQWDLWETGRAGNRNWKSYWSCQQLCNLWDGKSSDYYLLAAVLKMYLTDRGLRRLFISSVLQIWLHLYICIFFFLQFTRVQLLNELFFLRPILGTLLRLLIQSNWVKCRA